MFRRYIVLAGLTLALAAAGCSSAVERVNAAAIRASMSTEQDRKLALETMSRLPEAKVDYKIGAGDVLEISIFQWELSEETKTLDARVSQEGKVSLPLIGDMIVAGQTVQGVRSQIEERLRQGDLIKSPRVSVEIKEFRSKRVAVVGAVRDPGMYTLHENVTQLLDILSLAGGVADTSGQYLYVVRTKAGEKQIITVDLHDLLDLGDLTLNVVIADGDVVNVPVAQRFFVYGYVVKPGAYDLKRNTTLLEAVAMAGGLDLPFASPSACSLKRGDREIPIDLGRIADGKDPNLYLQADDIVNVRQTAARKVSLVLWEGFRSIFNVGYVINK